jgi:ethanolaminephosphotransferase
MMTCIPFFLNTWEEYYTGELVLPYIHGVSEGTVIACIAMNITGFYGRVFWQTPAFTLFDFTFQYSHIAALSCFLSGIGFGLWSLINVLINFKHRINDAIQNLSLFVLLITSFWIVVLFSDSLIVIRHPKVLIALYGFAFAKLVGHLQLAHLAEARFMQYRKSLLSCFVLLAFFTIVNKYSYKPVFDMDRWIVIFLVMQIVVWLHFAFYLTEELCEVLGIYRFSVKKRPTENKTKTH